jgi:hypothetical protein
MNILLDGTFELANGVDRTARVLGSEAWQWSQTTQEATYLRAAWATFFPSRATRQIQADLLITFPQSEDDEEAFSLAHELAALIPAGGTMEVTLGETTVTYAQFVPRSWTPDRIGVHVGLRITLTAVNPDVAPEAREQFNSGQFQSFRPGTFD